MAERPDLAAEYLLKHRDVKDARRFVREHLLAPDAMLLRGRAFWERVLVILDASVLPEKRGEE